MQRKWERPAQRKHKVPRHDSAAHGSWRVIAHDDSVKLALMRRVGTASGSSPAANAVKCLALGWLGLSLGCGNSAARVDASGRAPGDQALVPPQIQKPGQLRYFYANGGAQGPSLVLFEDPERPRVLSLGYPEGRYRAGPAAWSPGGRAFAYQLFAEETGIQPYRFLLADAAQGFEPRPIEHPRLNQRAYFVRWIGERAIAVQAGEYHDGYDDYGWTGRYLWIDVPQGSVTDLGELAGESLESPTFGVLPAAPASTAHLWASPFGLAYLDGDCGLVYLEDPAQKQTLVRDCSAVGSWSGDGSFLLVTTDTERRLYQRVDGRLEPSTALPTTGSPPPTARWWWAPSVPRFALSEIETDADGRPVIESLAFGDARTGAYVPVADLPSVRYADFVTDDLFVTRLGDENQPVVSYLTDLTELGSGSALQFAPLEASAPSSGLPVASSDSRRLYFPEDPLVEIALEAGRPSHFTTLFREQTPVRSVLFRLLDGGETGLLTTIEPEQFAPGGDYDTAFDRQRQYLLDLRSAGAVVPLGTFDLTHRSNALGLRTFISSPQLGGILYLGDNERGGFVDWLGFDDIKHKVRLLESPGCCLVLTPPRLSGIAASLQ